MKFEALLHQYRDVYYNFPQPLKIFLGSLYGNIPLSLRFGKHYKIHQSIIEKFENSNEQYKLDYMYNKTLETLLFAEMHIPYYKALFNQYGISSTDFKSLDDIKIFPELTKTEIKTHLTSLYSQINERAVPYYSGGSLSVPTKFFLPLSTRSKEKAYNNYIFEKIGYMHRDKALYLKGRDVTNLAKNIFWDYEPIDNYFVLSSNYLTSDKFPLMYKKTEEFNPKYIVGYPSAVINFIQQAKRNNVKRLNIKGIILTSETVYPHEYEIMQDYYDVDILIHYGHTERNAIAYKINQDNYSFLNSYGLVRAKDSELITTTFDNFVMPFINYRSGDKIEESISFFDTTDIVKSTNNITGRTQDYLVTKDRRLISITTMYYNRDRLFEKATAIQYIQQEIGKVKLLIESDCLAIDEVQEKIRKNSVYQDLEVDVIIVKSIEKSSRGKRIICKQALDINQFRL